MNDNMIIGNQIFANSADDGDAATAGPAGINIFSQVPITGTVIAQNSIRNEQIDIGVNMPSADVRVQFNNLQGPTGVVNSGAGSVTATQNFWGCAPGPGSSGCGGVTGTVVTSFPAAKAY
jgi:hypothetical protein